MSYLLCTKLTYNKNTIMTDEELRMFCLEQAVSLFIHAERARGLMPCGKSKSIFELSNAIIDYIKNGREAEIPGFFSKNTI